MARRLLWNEGKPEIRCGRLTVIEWGREVLNEIS